MEADNKEEVKEETKDDTKEFEEAYKMFDPELEGRITKSKLMDILTKLRLEPSEEDLSDMMREISGSGDYIPHDSFMKLVQKKKDESEQEQEIINAFR